MFNFSKSQSANLVWVAIKIFITNLESDSDVGEVVLVLHYSEAAMNPRWDEKPMLNARLRNEVPTNSLRSLPQPRCCWCWTSVWMLQMDSLARNTLLGELKQRKKSISEFATTPIVLFYHSILIFSTNFFTKSHFLCFVYFFDSVICLCFQNQIKSVLCFSKNATLNLWYCRW